MPYKCNTYNAAPCTLDSRFSKDDLGQPIYHGGVVNGNVLRKYRTLKRGETVKWVDAVSRKHFVPTDDATRAQDAKDYAWFLKELKSKKVSIPAGASLSKLASLYDDSDTRLKRRKSKKDRVVDNSYIPEAEAEDEVPDKSEQELAYEAERVEIKAWLKSKGEDVHHATGLKRLKQLKAEKEAEIEAAAVKEEG